MDKLFQSRILYPLDEQVITSIVGFNELAGPLGFSITMWLLPALVWTFLSVIPVATLIKKI